MKIIKRDGREVEFDQDKICIAIEKAAKSVNEEVDSEEISDKVAKQLESNPTVEEIEKIYRLGYEKGLKGITVFRDGSFREGILNVDKGEDKEKCPECGGQLIMQEGCNTCVDCGWSACSF